MPSILDDGSLRRRIDPKGMTELIVGLPEQCEEARRLARQVSLEKWDGIDSVVVLGMGGSAIGGDLVGALLRDELKVPYLVSREYSVPGFVSKRTLVIASSYSGNTEETLSACDQARARGARIVAITAGGELARRAKAAGWPLITIPGGISPRAAIGYSFIPLLTVLESLGLVSSKEAELEEMVSLLRRLRERIGPDVPADSNQAKLLAHRLMGKFPLIYGSQGWKGVVAYRWKCQINENGKNICAWNVFPELNHNETVGWEAPADLTGLVEAVVLRDSADLPRIDKRIQVTGELMKPAVSGISEVWAEGDGDLARMFSLIYIGDFVSLYLALLNEIDPTPVKVIDHLKSELASMN